MLQEVNEMFNRKIIAMLIALVAVAAFVLPVSAGYFGGSSDGQVSGERLCGNGDCQYQSENGECTSSGDCLYNGEGPQDGTGLKHGQQNKWMRGNSMNCGSCPYLNQ